MYQRPGESLLTRWLYLCIDVQLMCTHIQKNYRTYNFIQVVAF